MQKTFNATADFIVDENKISILGNTGARMTWGNDSVILDMNALNWNFYTAEDVDSIPILLSHSYDKPIGHVKKADIKKNDGGLWFDGVLSVDCEEAKKVLQSLKEGFPWTASISFTIDDGTEVLDGEEVEINGRRECGYFIAASTITLREVSICVLGADNKTQVFKAMEEEKEEVVKATNEEVVEVTDNQQEEYEEELVEASIEAPSIIHNAEAELEKERSSRSDAPTFIKGFNMENKNFEAFLAKTAGLNIKGYSESEQAFCDQFDAGSDLRDVFEAATGYSPTYTQRRNVGAWLREASSTYNLGYLVSNAAQKTLYAIWNKIAPNYLKAAKIDSAIDYRKAEVYVDSTDFRFEKIEENGTIPEAYATAIKAEIKVDDYAKTFAISNQAIRNGEAIGFLSTKLRQIAQGAQQTISYEFWKKFLNPGNVDYTGSSTAWYHANHKNLTASKPLNFSNLSAAIASFTTRSRVWGADAGEIMGIAPSYLVVPTSLEYTARMLVKSTSFGTGSEGLNPADYNPLNNAIEVIAEPMLENAGLTNYSATSWYLLANPLELPAFQINFLDNGLPTVRQDDIAINKLGMQITANFAFGCGGVDPRGVMKFTA